MICEYEARFCDIEAQKFVQTVAAKVADITDKAIMQALMDYADEYAKEKGVDYRLLIIDKKAAEELIELGMRAYRRGERI